MAWLAEHATPCRSTARHRRVAPYPRTPNTVRRTLPSPTLASFSGLIKKTWRLYKLSPVYNFSFKSDDLKAYSRLLSAHVQSVGANTAVAVEQHADTATVEHSYLPQGIAGEIIEITLKQKSNRGNGPAKVMLTAMFFSNSILDESESVEHDSSFSSFPLLWVNGSTKLTDHLLSWFQSQFSCSVSSMNLPSLQLCWIVAMFSGDVSRAKKSKPVQFVYEMRDEITGLSTITYEIDANDCRKVRQSISDEGSGEKFSSDQVMTFVMALEEHFFHHFKVKLSSLKLVQIGTASLCARVDGRIKIYSVEHVRQTLVYLMHLASRQVITQELA